MVTLRTIIISSSWAEHSKQSSVQLKTKALHRETWLAKLFIHPIYPSPFDLVTHFCPFSPSSSFHRHHKSIPSCRSNCNNNNHTHTPPLKPPEDDDLMIITSNSLRVLYRRPSSTLYLVWSLFSSSSCSATSSNRVHRSKSIKQTTTAIRLYAMRPCMGP